MEGRAAIFPLYDIWLGSERMRLDFIRYKMVADRIGSVLIELNRLPRYSHTTALRARRITCFTYEVHAYAYIPNTPCNFPDQ